MARPLRIEFAGAVYHVTSRGNERREVFRGDEDRAARDEAIFRAYLEGRFTQREKGDPLGPPRLAQRDHQRHRPHPGEGEAG